jgi:endonuclease YncB( thermonuclease family)
VEVTDDEIKAGKAAREFLTTLVASGEIHVTPQAGGKRDVYGRLLGEFWLRKPGGEWIDVAAEMKRGGHVRRRVGE